MPITGEPTPYYQTLLVHRTNDTVSRAVAHLTGLFPRPHNYPTAFGFALRKQRLGVELAEFDLLHRLHRGRPASFAVLCDVGEAIIKPEANRFPTTSIPLDEPLIVNKASFERLLRISEEEEPAGWRAATSSSHNTTKENPDDPADQALR